VLFRSGIELTVRSDTSSGTQITLRLPRVAPVDAASTEENEPS